MHRSKKFLLILLAAIPFLGAPGGRALAADAAETPGVVGGTETRYEDAKPGRPPKKAAPRRAKRRALPRRAQGEDVYACRESCLAQYDHCKTNCLDLYGDSPQAYGCISSCDLDLTYCRKRCR